MNEFESLLQPDTRQALDAARKALAGDPAARLAAFVAQRAGSNTGLTLVLALADPSKVVITKAEAKVKRDGLSADDVRAEATRVGFDLGDRVLRSNEAKAQAMKEIDAFVKTQTTADPTTADPIPGDHPKD